MLQFGIPELPERISVETCLIGPEAARLQNVETYDLTTSIPTNLLNNNTSTHITPISPAIPTNVPSVLPTNSLLPPQASPKTYTETEMNTDGPNPMRDRVLQTESPKLITIGIQCNIDEVLDEVAFTKALADYEASRENFDDLKKCFIDFVKEKAKRFKNGKFECKVCGEIKTTPKLIASHIAIHWGPPTLCTHCGLQFEHTLLMKEHVCAAKKGIKRQKIRCPLCDVNTISPAELFDHLNEHCGLRPHCCRNCKKRFATFDELRLHRKLHRKCASAPMHYIYALPKEDTLHRKRVLIVKTSRGKRVVVKYFLSQISEFKNRIERHCAFCRQPCKNVGHHKKHSRRCLNQYKQRLKRKRDLFLKKVTTNGHVLNGN